MNNHLRQSLVLSALLVQISALCADQAPPSFAWILICAETLFLIGSAGRHWKSLSGLLAASVLWLRWYPFFVQPSWLLTGLIQTVSGFILSAFGLPALIGGGGVTVAGHLVVADPLKTFSLSMLALLFSMLCTGIVRYGIVDAIWIVLEAGLQLFVWLTCLWPLTAALLGFSQPDPTWLSWVLFLGPLPLLVPLPILLSFGRRSRAEESTEDPPDMTKRLLLFCLLLLIMAGIDAQRIPLLSGGSGNIAVDRFHSTASAGGDADSVAPLDPWLQELSREFQLECLISSNTQAVSNGSFTSTLATDAASFDAVIDRKPGGLIVCPPPNRPYATSTIGVYERYVQQGGTLVLLAASPRQPAARAAQNRLLRPFGLTLGHQSLIAPGNRRLVTNACHHTFIPGSPGQHVSLWEPDSGIWSDRAFFPLIVTSPDTVSIASFDTAATGTTAAVSGLSLPFGPYASSVVLPVGKGLLVIVGDSTCFHSDRLMGPGKRAFGRSLMQLAGLGSSLLAIRFVVELVLSLLLCSFCSMLSRSSSPWIAALPPLLAYALWFGSFEAFVRPSDLPARLSGKPRLALDASLQPGLELPFTSSVTASQATSLSPLLVQLSLRGWQPYCRVSSPADLSVDQPDAFLLAAPFRMPTPAELLTLRNWVHTGGTLILASEKNLSGVARAVALACELRETTSSIGPAALSPDERRTLLPPIETDPDLHHTVGGIELSRASSGRGRVILLQQAGALASASADVIGEIADQLTAALNSTSPTSSSVQVGSEK